MTHSNGTPTDDHLLNHKRSSRLRCGARQAVFFCGDAILSVVTVYLALSLSHSRQLTLPLTPVGGGAALTLLVSLRLAFLLGFGIYRISPRHAGTHDLKILVAATTASSILFAIGGLGRSWNPLSANAILIDWAFNLLAVSSTRLACRIALNERWPYLPLPVSSDNGQRPKRILLVGAGAVGSTLAREIKRRSAEGLHLVGFLDDDPAKQHLSVDGAPVLGATHDVHAVVERRAIDEVIIAMPSAPATAIRDLSTRCEDLPVQLRISPGFTALNGERRFQELRPVSLEDLLRRPPVSTDLEAIAGYVAGERVLITGAGGSIGSELVRQLIAANPAELLLLGRGENSIFEIEQEIRRRWNGTLRCLIADVRDYYQMLQIYETHRPTVVFHAAAHKHVPLMESHPSEAILNNVYGTQNVTQLAAASGVKRLVMISTDKAVNPTNVMGVSKRIAEMVVQAESRRCGAEFAMVRFGNVLGSRGSVVPLMQKQIASGGPVTVTHPDVRRYFMTIPEAVQLVIQAGALGGHGNIYVLDMGDPVRIIDLARDLVRLSGLVPDRDIEIRITGLRPGEKLFEELLTAEEGVTSTRHERIFVARRSDLPLDGLQDNVEALIGAARTRNKAEMVRLLQRIEPGYQPSEFLLRQTRLRESGVALVETQAA
jgi:FlaA1/EpsC-like NDP-sugar epimerase